MISKKMLISLDVGIAAIVIISALLLLYYRGRQVTLQNKLKTVNQYKRIAMTGDIVYFSGVRPEIRTALGSRWNHVGMIIVNPEGKLFLWESNTVEDYEMKHPLIDQITMTSKDGPMFLNIEDKLASYSGSISIKQLKRYSQKATGRTRKQENKHRYDLLFPLIKQISTYKFEMGATFWPLHFLFLKGVIPFPCPKVMAGNAHIKKTAFCSELVGLALQKLGASYENIVPRYVMPHDFSVKNGKRILNKHWYLSPRFGLSKSAISNVPI